MATLIRAARLARPSVAHRARAFSATSSTQMKVLTVLYDGGEAARQEPRLLGTTENKLGIEQWLKDQGHEMIVTSDKEGPNSEFQKHLVDADVLITTPFHPAYLTADLIAKAKNLKLCVTAGVGSDHVDLNAASAKKITVAEVSGSNVVSVAEQVMMSILLLVRNYTPANEMVRGGNWKVSDIARNAFDLEGKVVGTIGAGRIGYRVLERLVPFNTRELLYYDYNALPDAAASKVNVKRVLDLDDFLSRCDVVTVNCPLHEGTINLINKDNIKKLKKGAWIVNTARGAICNAEAIKEAVESGHINGYAGDVWNVQPAPADHPWRSMKNPLGGGNGMTPHYSGTTLDAQARYASGTKQILENFFNGTAQDPGNLIVDGGAYATKNYGKRNKNWSTGETCLLDFKQRGWKASSAYQLSGKIIGADGHVRWSIGGRWNSKIYARFTPGFEATVEEPKDSRGSINDPSRAFVIWEANPRPEGVPFNLTPFAVTFNDLSDNLKKHIAPTDSRYRPDQRAMEDGEYDFAADEKNRLEEAQRARRKLREQAGEHFTPAWFEKATCDITGESYWKFNEKYWVQREKYSNGDSTAWDGLEPIYDDVEEE